MTYSKPLIISFSEEELGKTIIAFASCGSSFCAMGTSYGSTCGTAANYCPASSSYSPDTGFCPTGSSYTICTVGSNYTGPYNLNESI